MKRTILIGTALALFAVTTVAPAHGSSKKARKMACQDKSAGDPCSYEKKGTPIQGTCTETKHKKLMCTASDTGTSAPAPSSGAAGAPEAPGAEVPAPPSNP